MGSVLVLSVSSTSNVAIGSVLLRFGLLYCTGHECLLSDSAQIDSKDMKSLHIRI